MKYIFVIVLLGSLFTKIEITALSVSYAILTHNEDESLEKLLKLLIGYKQPQDEIVVVDDFSVNKKTINILNTYKSQGVRWAQHALNYDFAQQRNYLKNLCKGDWIFSIDADEIPSVYLLETIHTIINQNNSVDSYKIHRINKATDYPPQALDARYVNDRGWFMWPDSHIRIYKNLAYMKWFPRIHEAVVGAKNCITLPEEEKYALIHERSMTYDQWYKKHILYNKLLFIDAVSSAKWPEAFLIMKKVPELLSLKELSSARAAVMCKCKVKY